MATNRRDFLGFGIGSLIVAACGSRGSAAPRDALTPTPHTPDDDAPPADAFSAKTCGDATADNIEGPFYKPGAPNRATLATKDDEGERLVIAGSVLSIACEPIANATLDIWHADTKGGYDNDRWGMRGRMKTDANGRWQLTSIVPGRYMNGRRYRPAHVHVKLHAPGHRDLTTQLYFAGDPYNDGDDFIVSSLIMKHAKKNDVRRALFDFVLPPA